MIKVCFFKREPQLCDWGWYRMVQGWDCDMQEGSWLCIKGPDMVQGWDWHSYGGKALRGADFKGCGPSVCAAGALFAVSSPWVAPAESGWVDYK